jgi:carboxylesterase
MIIKTAEPFYFPGNSTGCLLIHGFTGTPKEMRPLGDFLVEKGYSVLGIRLSGHGTKMADIQRSHWQDWSGSVLDGWHLLQSSTDKVILMGLSMGGILALYHASFLPVQGIVCMSTPYKLGSALELALLPFLTGIYPFKKKGESDWHDPNAAKDHIAYEKFPTRAIVQLTHLIQAMRDSLPKVTAPALLMHAKGDLVVAPKNMSRIYQELGTAEENKEMVLLENSGHVVTRDSDKMTLFNNILSFVHRVQDPNL